MKSLIFVLDDDPLLLTSIREMLAEKDRVIKTFTSEQDMLMDSEINDVDLFIIEIVLRSGRRTGAQVGWDLSRRFVGIPFLFTAGHDKIAQDAYELANGNIADFIGKSYDPQTLRNRVSVLLRASSKFKQLKGEMTKAEELYSTIFWSNPIATAITKIDSGVVLDVNQEFENLIGYTRAELIGNSIFDFDVWKYPEDREKAVTILNRDGSLKNLEIQIKSRSGETIDCLFFGEVLHHEDQTQSIITTAIDITQRKKLIENLWSVFNYSTFFAVVLDGKANVRLCNYALAKALGLSSEDDMVGKSWFEFVPNSDAEIIQHVIDQLALGNSQYTEFTNDIITIKKKAITVKWFNSYINYETHSIFSVGVPLTKEITSEDTVDSIRSYFRDILRKDAQTIQSIKELALIEHNK